MTFRLQQGNSTTQWTQQSITRNILWYVYLRTFPQDVFVEFFFIFLFRNNGRVFCHFVRKHKSPWSQLLGLEPLTHTAEGSRQSHSLTLCPFVSLIHTYLHKHTHMPRQQTASTQDFGGTVEILYHSNTIATPTAEKKKKNSQGSAMAEQALDCYCFSRTVWVRFTFQHINMIGRPWKAMMFDLLAQKASYYIFTIQAVSKMQIHGHIHAHTHTHNFKHASQKQWNGHMS